MVLKAGVDIPSFLAIFYIDGVLIFFRGIMVGQAGG